jgi:hypothetical protein
MKVKIIFKIGSVRKLGSDRHHNTDQFGRGSDFFPSMPLNACDSAHIYVAANCSY